MNESTTLMTDVYLETLLNRVEFLTLLMIFNTVVFLYFVIRRSK
jgi:hypothetical protein